MIIKLFTRFYPVIPLWNHPKSLMKDLEARLEFLTLDNTVGPNEILFVEKGKEPKKFHKSEDLTVKMPGFVSPETMNEEGYFTQKAKHQIEELKKKGLIKRGLHNPEKKE